MKKKLSAIITALLLTLLLCVPAQAADGIMRYVIDDNDMLTYEDWEVLEDMAEEMSLRHNCGVYIVTVDDYTEYGDGDVYDVTTQIYNNTADPYGIGDQRDGIMLLLSLEARDWALFVHGDNAEYAFTAYGLSQMENSFLPSFGEDDWYSGLFGYLAVCDEYLNLAEAGTPVKESPVNGILTCIGVSCVIALVVCLVGKKKMKTVRHEVAAQTYIAAGGLQLTDQHDRFTHITETRRQIESGGSKGQVGGGGSGSSGKF